MQEIVRSYRHSRDIFSELIQNSVDAINRRHMVHNDPQYYLYQEFREKYGVIEPDPDFRGKLSIELDVDNRTLIVSDNGIGIDPDKIEKYILPKDQKKNLVKIMDLKVMG